MECIPRENAPAHIEWIYASIYLITLLFLFSETGV